MRFLYDIVRTSRSQHTPNLQHTTDQTTACRIPAGGRAFIKLLVNAAADSLYSDTAGTALRNKGGA